MEYIFIVMQGSRKPGGKGHVPLKIQWGPYEILPEGPMDHKNWRIGNVFQWRYPSNFAWGPWKFKWWEPQTLNTNVYREPSHDCILELLTASRIDCLFNIVDILKPLVSIVDLVFLIHFGASDMKVFDLTENEQILLWQVDILRTSWYFQIW